MADKEQINKLREVVKRFAKGTQYKPPTEEEATTQQAETE